VRREPPADGTVCVVAIAEQQLARGFRSASLPTKISKTTPCKVTWCRWHHRSLRNTPCDVGAVTAARPIEVAARELVSAGIDAHRVNPKLHRMLAEQVPRTGRLENVEAIDRGGDKLL